MKNESQTSAGWILKQHQVKHKISPNKLRECLGFSMHREGLSNRF